MLKDKLNLKMDLFHSGGLFLSNEEQQILQLSLPVLKTENKFTSVGFFGKIFGTKNDYYLAQGRGEDFIRNKIPFYSLDGISWRILFPPSDGDLSAFHLIRNRFTGDPTHKQVYKEVGESNKGVMKEERRLSALVKLLDFETAIGPKNALVINVNGIIEKNPYFKGLSKMEALDLNSYLHYRLPEADVSIAPTILICPPGGDRARQFLEPINLDFPNGSWKLQADALKEVVYLQNLWWPGYKFYYMPETAEYSAIYMGYGERNDDLPFMI